MLSVGTRSSTATTKCDATIIAQAKFMAAPPSLSAVTGQPDQNLRRARAMAVRSSLAGAFATSARHPEKGGQIIQSHQPIDVDQGAGSEHDGGDHRRPDELPPQPWNG